MLRCTTTLMARTVIIVSRCSVSTTSSAGMASITACSSATRRQMTCSTATSTAPTLVAKALAASSTSGSAPQPRGCGRPTAEMTASIMPSSGGAGVSGGSIGSQRHSSAHSVSRRPRSARRTAVAVSCSSALARAWLTTP